MGNLNFNTEDYILFFCKDLLNEIKNLAKDQKELEIKDINTKLVDFLMSDIYIHLGLEGATYEPVIGVLFKICDYFEILLLFVPVYLMYKEEKSLFLIYSAISSSHKNKNNFT